MKNADIDYFVFIHRLYANGVAKLGGLDYVLEYLTEENKRFIVVETPLYPNDTSTIAVKQIYKKETKILASFKVPFKSEYLVWFLGILTDLVISIIYSSKNSKVISSDPLASFPAVMLRKIGLFRYHYYHCTDYSETRFSNKYVNKLYRFLMDFSVKNSDLVGCVSKRIYEEIKHYKYKKIFYIPNSPAFDKYEKFRKSIVDRDHNTIVLTCAAIAERYKVLETIQLVHELSAEFKDIRLQIIGKTDLDKIYFQKVLDLIASYNLGKNVDIVGYVSRDENCELISKAYIGVAFYNKNDSYSWYSDPLKIREYAALGIPCVADLITSAAEEMRDNDAGFAVEEIPAAYGKIKQLLLDKDLYNKYSENSIKWAKKCDKKELVSQLFSEYLEK